MQGALFAVLYFPAESMQIKENKAQFRTLILYGFIQ